MKRIKITTPYIALLFVLFIALISQACNLPCGIFSQCQPQRNFETVIVVHPTELPEPEYRLKASFRVEYVGGMIPGSNSVPTETIWVAFAPGINGEAVSITMIDPRGGKHEFQSNSVEKQIMVSLEEFQTWQVLHTNGSFPLTAVQGNVMYYGGGQ